MARTKVRYEQLTGLPTATGHPAPYLDTIIPDSTLPNSTGNFQLNGSFFTPNMTVVFEGQTVNYVTFKSSIWVEVNCTMGSSEGLFDITLNNGISVTFPDVILLVLGTVFKPSSADWILTEPINVSDDRVQNQTYNSVGSAVWNKEFDYTKDFSVRWNFAKSPLGLPNTAFSSPEIMIKKVSDNALVVQYVTYQNANIQYKMGWYVGTTLQATKIINRNSTYLESYQRIEESECKLDYISGIFYFYWEGGLLQTYNPSLVGNVKMEVRLNTSDIKNIKYIELAT